MFDMPELEFDPPVQEEEGAEAAEDGELDNTYTIVLDLATNGQNFPGLNFSMKYEPPPPAEEEA